MLVYCKRDNVIVLTKKEFKMITKISKKFIFSSALAFLTVASPFALLGTEIKIVNNTDFGVYIQAESINVANPSSHNSQNQYLGPYADGTIRVDISNDYVIGYGTQTQALVFLVNKEKAVCDPNSDSECEPVFDLESKSNPAPIFLNGKNSTVNATMNLKGIEGKTVDIEIQVTVDPKGNEVTVDGKSKFFPFYTITVSPVS